MEVEFSTELLDIQKKVGTHDPIASKSKNVFKSMVKKKTMSYFNKAGAESIAGQITHSLRAYPDYSNHGKPQEYLLRTKKSSLITRFRLGDAGLVNRSTTPIRLCPICKTGSNTEAHLVFQCTSVNHIRNEW